jgi:hypothetical protein
VKAAAGSECLDREATAVSDSGIPLTVNEPQYNADGAIVGHREETRSAPQAVKVVLSCGACTCGGRFSVTVECDVAHFTQQPITAWTTEVTTLAIHCAGRGCEGTIVIKETPLKKALDEKPQRQ